MRQYLNLVQEVFTDGELKRTRTGIHTVSLPGAMMRFNVSNSFPAITTKKLAFKSVTGELCAFLRGSRNAADFRALGCKVWDQNANENEQWLANPYRKGLDDLGPVYGVQWREWPAYKRVRIYSPEYDAALIAGYVVVGTVECSEKGVRFDEAVVYKSIDQLGNCLKTIIENPDDRRILFHAWNPAELDAVALPACHLLYHFLPNRQTRELSMCLYVRSNDIGLGTPFNLAEGAALLHLVARLTGYTPKWFTYFIGDAHIYENHTTMLSIQMARTPYAPPKLRINKRVPDFAITGKFEPEWLKLVEPSDFELIGYQHHAPLTAPMAV